MGDLVLDAHKNKTPLDHPDQSVTSDKIAPQEHITFELLTSDPPLTPGRWWIRIDTKELRYTLDGVKIHVIPLPFSPFSIDKHFTMAIINLLSDSHLATSLTLAISSLSLTLSSHTPESVSLPMPTIGIEYSFS